MNIYYQHFLAWLRGDIVKITGVFQKAIADLEAHKVYLTTIADNQASAARELSARATALYDEADKAAALKLKLAGLVS